MKITAVIGSPSRNGNTKARALGYKLARDIRTGRSYPLQTPVRRFITRFLVRPAILKNIRQNKDGMLKAVWETLN